MRNYCTAFAASGAAFVFGDDAVAAAVVANESRALMLAVERFQVVVVAPVHVMELQPAACKLNGDFNCNI